MPKTLPAALALAVSVVLLSACSKPAPAPEPVRAVKLLTVGVGGLQSSGEFAGEVRARVESRLAFRVGGKVVQRQAELGQRVRAGQVLAQLDAQDYRLSADAARAQLAGAATNRDLAQADFKRFKELREQNFISSAELERREATLKAAQAQFEAAQAQLAGLSNQAAYTSLVADVAGVVTAVEAEVGQVVAAGTPVFRIAKDGPRDVVFSVPEDKVGMVRLGSAASVTPWSSADSLAATVREVASSADPVTRTFAVKLAIDPKHSLPLGSTVTVQAKSFDRSGIQAIRIPTNALRREADYTAVWVLDPAAMVVNLQRVEVLTADGNMAVVGAGLKPGMQIVAAGVHVLSPGQKVTVYQDQNAASAPAAQTGK
jgi:RND family efflux transporter MFP subunit